MKKAAIPKRDLQSAVVEGVYTKYDFWEDFGKVEKIPKGTVLLSRKRKPATPIDPSTIPIPGSGKTAFGKTTSAELDINNDLGMIARQLLPGSFG